MTLLERYVQLQTQSETKQMSVKELDELLELTKTLKSDKNRGNEIYKPAPVKNICSNCGATLD